MVDWLSALNGVGGTALGSGIGYRGALSIHKQSQQEAHRSEVRRALADYLGELYVSVAELRELPPPADPCLVERGVEKARAKALGEHGSYLARRQMEHEVTGDRYRELGRALVAKATHLQVSPLSDSLRAVIDESLEYVQRLSEDRSPKQRAGWSRVYASLMAEAKRIAR